ncbi:hypothetical protein [Sphingomonas sp.]|uniref:hypothetical protein n=1 Tax=Sphingomonas sp. TaxID=28214 RepID=UPI0031DFB53A
MTILIALALQAASTPPTRTPEGGERFSILARDPCPPSAGSAADIVVCGRRQADDRLTLNKDEPPAGPAPSNPEMTGIGALRASSTPCAARIGGCQVGFNLLAPALLLANEARIGISKLVDKARDKSNRVPIALDGPGPSGHLEP